jgi:hypothetical protein
MDALAMSTVTLESLRVKFSIVGGVVFIDVPEFDDIGHHMHGLEVSYDALDRANTVAAQHYSELPPISITL